MESILSLLQTIGIFAAAIFILVLIHELGHFLAAKLFKMRVERFFYRFSAPLVRYQKGGYGLLYFRHTIRRLC